MTFSRDEFRPLILLLIVAVIPAAPAQEYGSPIESNSDAAVGSFQRESPFKIREFGPLQNGYRARGISYGPYRVGQRPGGEEPTAEQVQEDLKLLVADNWQMIRIYGVEPFAEKVCRIIQQEKLELKVMVGAWIATEKDDAAQQRSNRDQVLGAIKLANQYPEIVAAVSVGNETQVFWSFHKVEQSRLIESIRQVRSQIKQPVTVADDFKYWISDESKTVASEIDFIVTHIYAMWVGEQLDAALKFTQDIFEQVRMLHPDRVIVIGEAGWATRKSSSGEQAQRIKGQAGEAQQKRFFDEYSSWLQSEKIPFFYFEAFDEPWKGSNDPDDAEKHWGLFRVDRTRKAAIAK